MRTFYPKDQLLDNMLKHHIMSMRLRMVDIRKLAKQNGCSLPWIAANVFGITRQGLYYKIDTDTFTADERVALAYELKSSPGEIWPELFPEAVEA